MTNDWIPRLTDLGRSIRDAISARRGGDDLATPVAFEGGDTIYEIDKRVEPILIEHAEKWTKDTGPVTIVAEGLGGSGTRTIGPGEPAWRVLIDPIDGTRNIMYDKRSAWFLGAVAPDKGPATALTDIIASVMVELPTSKAGLVDEFSAAVKGPARCRRASLTGSSETEVPLHPSTASTLRHGWGQVANFFPGTKVLAAELMEWIASETLGNPRPGEALVFDDQYLTTGGQLVELICGRDRFCCDLRPLLFEIIRRRGDQAVEGLACHPYDMAGLLVAQRAGVIITDGFGRKLDAPFSVNHPVHWCGYANESLRNAIEPIIEGWLREKGLKVPIETPPQGRG